MTFRETALINKGKREMKIWGDVYHHYFTKGNSTELSTLKANEAVIQFQLNFNEYGNIV